MVTDQHVRRLFMLNENKMSKTIAAAKAGVGNIKKDCQTGYDEASSSS